MDSFDDDSFGTSSSIDETMEAIHDLLEEGWFYGKLLNTKPIMLRCYSDLSPSFDQEILAKNPCSEKSSTTRKVAGNLIRSPSLPPSLGEEEKMQEKGKNHGTGKLTRQLSDQTFVKKPAKPACAENKEGNKEKGIHTRRSKTIAGKSSQQHHLLRTPSLPPYIGREEVIEENESDDITMSRLIRQAMPQQRASKGTMQSSNIPKHRPPRNSDADGIDAVGQKETRHLYPNAMNLKKSLRDLECHEVQGFKDLGFTFNKEDLNPSVVHILPGLQEKRKDDQCQEKLRRPYMSEAWHVQSCAPPIPVWTAKNSAEDMKAHLKFWARAVASNVR